MVIRWMKCIVSYWQVVGSLERLHFKQIKRVLHFLEVLKSSFMREVCFTPRDKFQLSADLGRASTMSYPYTIMTGEGSPFVAVIVSGHLL